MSLRTLDILDRKSSRYGYLSRAVTVSARCDSSVSLVGPRINRVPGGHSRILEVPDGGGHGDLVVGLGPALAGSQFDDPDFIGIDREKAELIFSSVEEPETQVQSDPLPLQVTWGPVPFR